MACHSKDVFKKKTHIVGALWPFQIICQPNHIGSLVAECLQKGQIVINILK